MGKEILGGVSLVLCALCAVAAGCQSGGAGNINDADDDSGDDGGAEPSRWILLDGSMNTRDIGGYEVSGEGSIRWRKLIRSGHVSGLTTEGCDSFDEIGIKTVIDLRMESEYSTSPPAACVAEKATVVNVPMEKILPPNIENYLALMERSDDALAPLFSTLSQSDGYPVLYHCIIGRDRVNFANALIMAALGASRDTILEEYRLGDGVEDEWIEAVLDEVDRQGGIDAYLAAKGVETGHVAALRSAVLE